jgi:hypothetical protein
MCLGPGCNSGQIHDGGYENPIMTCNSCGFQTCFIHKLPWHTGMTCPQFDARPSDAKRAKQEAASKKLLLKTSQLCPGCKRHIQKVSGCDHMTCKSWLQWRCRNLELILKQVPNVAMSSATNVGQIIRCYVGLGMRLIGQSVNGILPSFPKLVGRVC